MNDDEDDDMGWVTIIGAVGIVIFAGACLLWYWS